MENNRIAEIPGGFWVAKDDTHISRWQIDLGRLDHDQFLTPFCCQFIPVGGFVLDGGAFSGDHSIAYSRKAGPVGMVLACEPGQLAFRLLAHNTLLFEHQNVFPLPFSLGDKLSTTSHVENDAGNLGMSRVYAGGTSRMITIDALVHPHSSSNRPVDFIKLDLEGWELKALRGAQCVLEFDRPVMVIEINEEALRLENSSYEEIRVLLKDHDYNFGVIQPECRDKDCPQFDILCLPKESSSNLEALLPKLPA